MSSNKLIWTKKDRLFETVYTLYVSRAQCDVMISKAGFISWRVYLPLSLNNYYIGDYANSVKQAKRNAISRLRHECKHFVNISSEILDRIG